MWLRFPKDENNFLKILVLYWSMASPNNVVIVSGAQRVTPATRACIHSPPDAGRLLMAELGVRVYEDISDSLCTSFWIGWW